MLEKRPWQQFKVARSIWRQQVDRIKALAFLLCPCSTAILGALLHRAASSRYRILFLSIVWFLHFGALGSNSGWRSEFIDLGNPWIDTQHAHVQMHPENDLSGSDNQVALNGVGRGAFFVAVIANQMKITWDCTQIYSNKSSLEVTFFRSIIIRFSCQVWAMFIRWKSFSNVYSSVWKELPLFFNDNFNKLINTNYRQCLVDEYTAFSVTIKNNTLGIAFPTRVASGWQ